MHSVSLNDRISVRLRGARRYVEMRTVLFWSDATSAWHDRLARGTVYTIVAEGGGGGPAPLLKTMAMDARSVPISAGSQRLSATIRVVYQLK